MPMSLRRARHLAGGIAASAALALGALASTASTASAATPTSAGAVSGPAATMHVTLNSGQCTSLRAGLHDPAASCTIAESLHVRPLSATPDSVYEQGLLEACASMDESGNCNTSEWWVRDTFHFTLNNGNGVYNNGTPDCTCNHTTFSWCGYADSGTSTLSEGFNFGKSGSGDYARMDIDNIGNFTTHGTPGSIYGSRGVA